MESQLEEIRDKQKEVWNKFSPGWKKWDVFMMDFLKPMGDEIIRELHPSVSDVVLDVASGTGEPGLTIASMLDSGKVVSVDLSKDMLSVANEKAKTEGIKNFATLVCDVSELPFDDNTFDAVSCRFGFMFFPDMLKATQEMHRVLKPGGRIATSVWNVPEKNFWITSIMGTINRNMQIPPPPAGAPGMFRCAANGLMTNIFTEAGFKNVLQTEIAGSLNTGTADVFWQLHNDVGAPIVAALSKADDAMRTKIKSEVYELLHKKFGDNPVNPEASALVIYGEK
ncbi:MAG: class I SAM-dependent methyltransferase [Ginsengibacter sp.]